MLVTILVDSHSDNVHFGDILMPKAYAKHEAAIRDMVACAKRHAAVGYGGTLPQYWEDFFANPQKGTHYFDLLEVTYSDYSIQVTMDNLWWSVDIHRVCVSE